MSQRGIDVLMVNDPENIYYLSGFRTIGFYSYMALVIPASGQPVHVNRLIEMSTLQGTSCVEERRLFPDTEDPIVTTAELIKEKGWDRGRLSVDSQFRYLTVAEYDELRRLLPSVDLVASELLVETLRLVKSPAEQEYSRRAGMAASNGMRRALEALRDGITEDDLMAAAYQGLFERHSEYPGLPPLINAGYRHTMAHAMAEGYPVSTGDAVYFEIGASIRRYHAASLRIGSVGKPTDELVRLSDLCRRSLDAGLAVMRPGNPAGLVDDQARKVIDDAGYGAHFRHKAGYSIGIAFPPDWSEARTLMLRHGEERRLVPGMVFHFLPAVFEYEQFGIGVSETVLITEDGHEVLTDVPRHIHEAPSS